MFGVMIVKLGDTPYRWIKPMHLVITPHEWREHLFRWLHAGAFTNGLLQHHFDTYPDRDQRYCEIEWIECKNGVSAFRHALKLVNEDMWSPSHDLRHIVNLADLLHIPGSVRFPNEDVVHGDSIFLLIKEHDWWTDYGVVHADLNAGPSQSVLSNTVYRDFSIS